MFAVSFVLCIPAHAQAGTAPEKPAITVMPFAVADGAAPGADPAKLACPAAPAELRNLTPDDAPAVLAALTAQLQQKLGQKFAVTTIDSGQTPAEGALTLTGCLVAIDAGNATRRIVGAGMGGSLLRAHVRIVRMNGAESATVQEFDEESKGRNFGVGSGMLVNAMRSHRTSLAGDAENLADKIATQLKKTVK